MRNSSFVTFLAHTHVTKTLWRNEQEIVAKTQHSIIQMMDIVHPVQMCIVGTVKTKAIKLFSCLNHTRRFPHLSLNLIIFVPHVRSTGASRKRTVKQCICKNGYRFSSLKLAGEKSRNNEYSLSVAKV